MKKNLLALVLAFCLLTMGLGLNQGLSMTAKATEAGSAATEQPAAEDETFSFADLQHREFYFASGAGGWRTVMSIKVDGSFAGVYSDSEMGSVGEGYPKGTYYLCEFEGVFTDPVQVNDYTYSVKIDELRCLKEPETTEIIDEILYHYSTPYGIEGAEEILIYLPGAPISELPEEYMNWVRNDMADPEATELPFYGLYNATEQNGFSSYDALARLDEYLASVREQADLISASLEKDPLTQFDMNQKSAELAELWDLAMNAVWNVLEGTMTKEELFTLTENQQEWIAVKDAVVEKAGAEVQGGSMYPLVVNSEAARLTEERVSDLYGLLRGPEFP